MLVMDRTAVRVVMEKMQAGADEKLQTAIDARCDAAADYERCFRKVTELNLELAGFASLMGHDDSTLIAELQHRKGWDKIPPETIPAVLRRRQEQAERELYDARRARDAALLKLKRAGVHVEDMTKVVTQFQLLMERPDDVLIAFLQQRGWQVNGLDRTA